MSHHPLSNAAVDQQRRRLLKTCGAVCGSAAAFAYSGVAFSAASRPEQSNKTQAKSPAVGLQLYTVRELMEKSVADTLKLVAGVGYQQVEFAGYFNESAKSIRALLSAEGLTAPSAHISLEQLQNNLDKVIEDALIVGPQYLVLPYLLEDQRGRDIAAYQRLAADLNKFGERCKQAGLHMAYHNHAFEFEAVTGGIPYDTLLGETDPALVSMELDLYWTVKAGLDPVALFKKHPGRFALWHVKDMDSSGNFADVGKGVIDFKSIFANSATAGVKHQFVERDQTSNKVATISQGFQAVSGLLKAK